MIDAIAPAAGTSLAAGRALRPCLFDGKLIIHVGPHKTGTTTIQNFLNANSTALRQAGILYPSAGRGKVAPAQHWDLGEAIVSGDFSRLEEFARALERELEAGQPQTLVNSTEVLSRKMVTAEQLSLLVELFPQAKRVWVVVLRRQDELLKSTYSEHLKKGLIAYPDDHRTVSGPEFLDHLRRLQLVLSASPDDPVIVARFDDIKQDLVGNFLTMIGYPASRSEQSLRSGHENRSVPGKALRIIRYVNSLPSWLSGPIRKRLVKFAHEHPRLFSGDTIDPDAVREITKTYILGNQVIECTFFAGREPQLAKPAEYLTQPALDPIDSLQAKRILPWHFESKGGSLSTARQR